jgi:ribosomal protein S18 acetylase RimI-like enzyme
MLSNITCQLEQISLEELTAYMRFQADESFPSLKAENKLQTFASKLHDNADFCVSRDNGEMVGMIAYYANGQGADFAYIPHVYVSPEYRKMKLFATMLNRVELDVRQKGFTEIRLEVSKDNTIAQSAYSRNGFSPIEIESSDSIFMSKSL